MNALVLLAVLAQTDTAAINRFVTAEMQRQKIP